METLLNKLEEDFEQSKIHGDGSLLLSKEHVEHYISLLKGSNQPSGEGVKSPESYLQGMESVYSPTSIGANYPESDVIKALTAQARDYEQEKEEFAQFCEDKNGEYATAADLLYEFRNDRSKPKE